MSNYVHRLSDPRDPAYPFSDTFVCSKCNERLLLDAITCDICNLYIYGEVDSSSTTASTYPEPSPFNKSYIVNKSNSTFQKNTPKPENKINPEIDKYIKSIFSQSLVIFLLITLTLIAFLYFDYTNIVIDFNYQLIGK